MKGNGEHTFRMLCEVLNKMNVQRRVVGLEGAVDQDASDTNVVPLVKEADVLEKVEQLRQDYRG